MSPSVPGCSFNLQKGLLQQNVCKLYYSRGSHRLYSIGSSGVLIVSCLSLFDIDNDYTVGNIILYRKTLV